MRKGLKRKLPSNNSMQPDQVTRCARALAADAWRYAAGLALFACLGARC